jgi:hypothetical protein
MSGVPEPPAPPPEPPRPPSPHSPRTGRLALGALLILFGVGWLLEALDVTDFAWDVLLPSALILVGVALLVTSRSPTGHGGLITMGIVLSVVLLVGSAIDFPIGGGVGDRSFRPASASVLRSEYRLGIGELTLDLTGLSGAELAGSNRDRVRVRLGIGQLVVIVPDGVSIRVAARAGLGSVQLFDEGGFDVEQVAISGSTSSESVFELELSVGIGEVEVRRG